MPIIDYHNHLAGRNIWDLQFENIQKYGYMAIIINGEPCVPVMKIITGAKTVGEI
jgi:hypothetical protein